MKNNIFCLVLFASLFVFFACGGTPSTSTTAPAAKPAATPSAPAPKSTPAASSSNTDIILDGASTYTVVSGDTLSKISQGTYKNGFYYPLIMMASKNTVKDQDYIQPGMVLTVPKLQANLDNAKARESMKKFFLEIADITESRRPEDAAGLRKLVRDMK